MMIEPRYIRLLCKEGIFELADTGWTAEGKFPDHGTSVADHATVAFCDSDGKLTGQAMQFVRISDSNYGSMILPSVEQAALLHAHRVRSSLEGFDGDGLKYRIFLKGSRFNGAVNGAEVKTVGARR